MAIQTDIKQSQFGVPFSAAYFRILTVHISRRPGDEYRHGVSIDLVGYPNKPLDEDQREIDSRRYHAPLNEIEAQAGDTLLAKCYAWVMTQPDMVSSVGV